MVWQVRWKVRRWRQCSFPGNVKLVLTASLAYKDDFSQLHLQLHLDLDLDLRALGVAASHPHLLPLRDAVLGGGAMYISCSLAAASSLSRAQPSIVDFGCKSGSFRKATMPHPFECFYAAFADVRQSREM